MAQSKTYPFDNLFIVFFLAFQTLGWLSFLFFGKENIFLAINGFGNQITDYFFFLCTLIGEWPTIVFVLLYIFLYNREEILKVTLAYIILAITAFTLKNYVFTQNPRPASYFKDNLDLVHFSPYLEMGYWQSFPSGHTFTAFTGLAFLSFVIKKKWGKLLCFVMALLAGISRIYNGMHFPEDVLVGSLLGVLLSYIIYTFVPSLTFQKQKV